MWIGTQARPDIANAVRVVARHSHDPKETQWKMAQRFSGTSLRSTHLGLMYSVGSHVDSTTYNVRRRGQRTGKMTRRENRHRVEHFVRQITSFLAFHDAEYICGYI